MDPIKLKELLTYDPITGIFTWNKVEGKSPQWNGRFAGKIAGSLNNKGYVKIGIDKKYYSAHRLAFLFMGLPIPEIVDHTDRDKSNNKWNNLRASDTSNNAGNSDKYRTNTSGYKNVSWAQDRKLWYVKVIKNSKIHGGYYKTLEEAISVANSLRKELYGDSAIFEEIRKVNG